MSILKITIPIGVGDLLYIKAMLDNTGDRYQEIYIRFHRDIITFYQMDPNYNKFLDDMGALFFGQPPYILTEEAIPFYGISSICSDNKIVPIKPNLKDLLCIGKSENIDGEYIVVVTKVRYMPRAHFNMISGRFFTALKRLSEKYKIVILGEKEVYMNPGYLEFKDSIYSIYNDIIDNIPQNRIVDLTLPTTGNVAPNLKQIQQDCLTLSGAKVAITIGVGGGMSMATAVANVVGYRIDQDPIADVVFQSEYPDAIITKNLDYFIHKLNQYLR